MPPPDGPDIAALIAVGRESASLEYKRSAPWDDLRVNLIRTVIGMANTRSGGRIVIGMAERDDGNFSPDGLDDEHIASFPAEEDLRATVNGFAQPFIEPLRDEREYEGKRFLVITVPEFEQEPVLCMKTEGRRLREGALYVRSTRKPETVEVRNPTDHGQGADWIASWWSVDEESQYWRLYQSGQFVHLLSFWEDRQNARDAITAEYYKWSTPTPLPACSTGYLSFREAIQRLTAIFGFASRLMVAGALGGAPVLRIEMKQIKDRHLVFYGYTFGFAEPRDYRAHEDIGREWRLALGDDPLERAREAAHWFFERFGRPDTSETALKLAQEDFLNNRWR